MKKNKEKYQHYIPEASLKPNYPECNKHHLVDNIDELTEIFEKNKNVKYMSMDTETTSLDPTTGQIVGFSFSFKEDEGYYVPLRHRIGKNCDLKALDLFYNSFLNKTVFFFNYRFDARYMEYSGFDMSKVKYYDVQIGCWLADTNIPLPSLKRSERHFMGWSPSTFEETLGTNYDFSFTDPKEVYIYACVDAEATFALVPYTLRFFKEAKLSGKLDNDVLYPLMKFEDNPIPVNVEKLSEMYVEVEKHLRDLENNIYTKVGKMFSINSNQQLGSALQSVGINTGKYTATGQMQVSIKALEDVALSNPDPLLDDLVSYSKNNKLLNSYIGTLRDQASEYDGMLRFAYKTCGVPTGRLASGGDKKNSYFAKINIQSCPKPNPKNYYVKDYVEGMEIKEGETRILDWVFTDEKTDRIIEGEDQHLNIRSVFTVPDDSYFISLDYSAEELRLIANLSGEKSWIDTFNSGGDLHKQMAIQMWGKENYDNHKRKLAKCVTGDTLISTENGLVRIDSLSDFREDDSFTPLKIKVLTKDGIEKTKYFYYGGKVKTYTIETESGYKITGTSEHPLWDGEKFVKIKKLKLNDKLQILLDGLDVNEEVKLNNDVTLNKELAKVLGVLQIDLSRDLFEKGSLFVNEDYTGLSCIKVLENYIVNNNITVYDDFMNHFTDNVMYRNRSNFEISDKDFYNLLRENNLYDKEHISEAIFKSPKYVMKEYVKYLFERKAVYGRLEENSLLFDYKYLSFLEDLQKILANLGVFSEIIENYDYQYALNIPKEYLSAFKDNVGFVERDEKESFLVPNLGLQVDYYLKNNESVGKDNTKIVLDSIKKITESENDVFDLTVKKEHNFISNCFISHNTLNFGMAYGMSASSLAARYNLPYEEADDVVKRYWASAQAIKNFQNRSVKKAKRLGYFYNAFGRPRRVKSYFASSEGGTRAFGARTVNNGLIQSAGGDILKISIIKLWKNLYNNEKYKDKVQFHSTIHDEINTIVKKDITKEVVEVQRKCMELKLPNWPVPIVTGIEIGDSWGNCFPFHYVDGELLPDWDIVED